MDGVSEVQVGVLQSQADAVGCEDVGNGQVEVKTPTKYDKDDFLCKSENVGSDCGDENGQDYDLALALASSPESLSCTTPGSTCTTPGEDETGSGSIIPISTSGMCGSSDDMHRRERKRILRSIRASSRRKPLSTVEQDRERKAAEDLATTPFAEDSDLQSTKRRVRFTTEMEEDNATSNNENSLCVSNTNYDHTRRREKDMPSEVLKGAKSASELSQDSATGLSHSPYTRAELAQLFADDFNRARLEFAEISPKTDEMDHTAECCAACSIC